MLLCTFFEEPPWDLNPWGAVYLLCENNVSGSQAIAAAHLCRRRLAAEYAEKRPLLLGVRFLHPLTPQCHGHCIAVTFSCRRRGSFRSLAAAEAVHSIPQALR